MIFKNHNSGFLFLGICIWGLLFLGSKSAAQEKSLSFNHLDVTDGLSNNSVISINQDPTGFIWIGTKYGLNRFDGRTFKVFKNEPYNKTSISSSDYIRTLELAMHNTMWVVSSGGLDLYHSNDNSFESVLPQSEGISKTLQDTKGNLWIGTSRQLKFKPAHSKKIISFKIAKEDLQVTEFFEDHAHHIWLGTAAGLYEVFFANKKMVVKRHFSSQFKKSDPNNTITAITQDQKLRYWIGTKNSGLYLFDKKTMQLTHFVKNNNDKNALINNNVRKILLHKNGSLWIGTQDGLSIMNPNTLQFTNYQHDPANPNSLSQNSIYDIFQDKDGSVWIGTYFGGVNVVYSVNTPFSVYQNSFNKNSISSNIVSEIVEDNNHNLWIGTEAGGLNYFNRNTNQFITYKNILGNKNSLGSNLVKDIAIDKNHNVWIGTTLGGLNLFDPKTSSFMVFKRNPSNNNNSIASDNVNCLVASKQNKLFIGTDIGLTIYDIAQKKFTLVSATSASGKTSSKPFNLFISALFEDKKGNIWIGTPKGIFVYQNSKLYPKNLLEKHSKKRFTFDINCFHQDSRGQMWVGTYHNGLALLDLKSNSFKTYNTTDGLPNDNILSIAEDNDTNLWLGTDNGLAKYNRRLNTFRNFTISDGLPDNQFNINSVLKDSQGRFFFGTYNGLLSFIPQNIQRNTVPPNVVLSNLKLFNFPVKVNDESGLLKEDINFSKELTFNHRQNNFTIDFSALNFIKSEKNKYAYRLDGFEKNWNYVDIPLATYTNLPDGHYEFLVKSANNDGIWSENIKKIKIVVLPPFWETWWAYFIYYSSAIAIIYYVLNFLKARADLKKELDFEKMKLDFFTNISHEIRTPLTLILGPIEKLAQLSAENTQAHKYVTSIKKNTERLYRLVNELLDFRKVDSGNMRLHFFEEDIVSVAKENFDHFQTLAEAKNIQYTFESSHSPIFVYFDKDQMEKVFFNLLSNAFKFTQNGGSISLEIVLNNQKVKIKVKDNGKGIAIDNINDIFKNFYQAGQNMGTGIGLALSKSLIELHKGKIKVSSKPASATKTGKTTFTVTLQLGKKHINEIDIAPALYIENPIYEEMNDSEEEENGFIDRATIENKNKKTHILIVEDNDEVREFIKQSLEDQYLVSESENGLEGWKKAIQELPDLIITDVMMPVMDGMELCKKLKTDIRTSHIPVIMLTAKSAPIHEIHGLQHGADVYITKPFNDQKLHLNIRNLLSLRAALQKKYSEQLLELPIITTPESSQEEVFLQKLQQIIEKNISNPNLDLNFITTEIGMSKSGLYNKFNALTNLSLNEFIRVQRLKHAVELFQKGETSILSAALQVGFNDTRYFSREFKKVYGITPSEYIKNKGQAKN